MAIRDHNLDSIGALTATFKIHQTAGNDDLKDSDIGKAVALTGNYEIGFGNTGDPLIGKLIDLSLTDADKGRRVATVQIAGTMTLPTVATIPALGNRVVVNGAGAVRQAPVLSAYDPAGGNVARGTVINVNGTTDVTLILN
jgi:hypothetical protein